MNFLPVSIPLCRLYQLQVHCYLLSVALTMIHTGEEKKGIVNRDTNKWTNEQTKICIKRIKTAEIVTPRPLLFLKKGEREVSSTRCNVFSPSYINFSKCLENSHMYNLNWGLWGASFEGKKEQSLNLNREWMK